MALEEILQQAEIKMKKAIDAVRKEAQSVRTGRASPSLVEGLEVDAYGTPTPLIQLGQISAPEPRLIVIQPWDKSLLKAIEKARVGNTPAEVRQIFDKAAQVDDFKAITGKDLDISKVGDKVVVKFAYNKEIHMAGPAYLLLKYQGQTK